MIDERSLREAIAYYGGKVDPMREDAIALAACYILQDHLFGKAEQLFGNSEQFSGYSTAPPPEIPAPETVGEYGESEFLRAVAGKDPAAVWKVVDELMDDLAVINPRVYAGVMRKIG